MAQGGSIVREFARTKRVEVNCKNCDKTVGDFTEFKPAVSRKEWKGKLDMMDWEIKFKVDSNSKKLSCDCGNELGTMVNDNDVLFKRNSMQIKY